MRNSNEKDHQCNPLLLAWNNMTKQSCKTAKRSMKLLSQYTYSEKKDKIKAELKSIDNINTVKEHIKHKTRKLYTLLCLSDQFNRYLCLSIDK